MGKVAEAPEPDWDEEINMRYIEREEDGTYALNDLVVCLIVLLLPQGVYGAIRERVRRR